MIITYKNKNVYLSGIKLKDIIKDYSTPLYLYCEKTLIKNYNNFLEGTKSLDYNSQICFAIKANPNLELLKVLQAQGAGADVVSFGELKRALKAKISPNKIVFSGVGKTEEELRFAISKDIYSIHVESASELKLINKIAKELNIKAKISFRLNPEVQAKTHKYISTGHKSHKFGLLESEILSLVKENKHFSHTKLIGLSTHIGSQLLDLKATGDAIKSLCLLAMKLPIELEFLDVGGGLGISYNKNSEVAPKIKDYMELVNKTIKNNLGYKVKILFEPGRRIIASSGQFISQVTYIKHNTPHNFLILDGGMNDFMRPALYEAYHEIKPAYKREKNVTYDIVGPVCESTDVFAKGRVLTELKEGDYVVFEDAGAYGYSMSSTYNLRPRPQEVLITKDNKLKLINKKSQL